MNENIRLGSIIQDWHEDSLVGTYVVTLVPLGGMTGSKYALVNVNGDGLVNGYFNSLDELEKMISQEQSWKVFNIDLEKLITYHIELAKK